MIDKNPHFRLHTSTFVHAGRNTNWEKKVANLDRTLWLIMLLPYLAVITILLGIRLTPIWTTLWKTMGWWPKILLIGQQLVKDDENPMHWSIARCVGFLAFVVVGGKWILNWWPPGPEAAIPISGLFVINLNIIMIYTIIITVGTCVVWSYTPPTRGLKEFAAAVLYKLFVPIKRDFLVEFALVVLLLMPWLLNRISNENNDEQVEASVAYASVNHHAEVARDPNKIYAIELTALTKTLCARAMGGDGLAFAEEGVKNAWHAQYYARCAVLLHSKDKK